MKTAAALLTAVLAVAASYAAAHLGEDGNAWLWCTALGAC